MKKTIQGTHLYGQFMKSFRFLFSPFFVRQLLKHKKKIAITMAILLVHGWIGLLLPLPLKFIIDQVLAEGVTQVQFPGWLPDFFNTMSLETALVLSVVAFAGVYFLDDSFGITGMMYLTKVSNSFIESGRKELVGMVLTRNTKYLSSKRKSDLVGRISQDVNLLQFLTRYGIPLVMRTFPSIPMIVGILLLMDSLYAVLATASILFTGWATFFFTKRIKKYRKRMRAETTFFEQLIYQSIDSFNTIKSQNLEAFSSRKIARHARGISNEKYNAILNEEYLGLTTVVSTKIVQALIIIICGLAVFKGHSTAGTVVLLVGYIDRINKLMKDFYKFAFKSANSYACLERIEELIAESENEKEPTSGAKKFGLVPLKLTFKDIGFSFDSSTPVIEDFNYQLKPGKMVGIEGPSGIGKSTILLLMNRLLEPNHGKILANGQNICSFDNKSLREQLSFVPQETHLITGTIRENINPGNRYKISDQDIKQALWNVGADQFVEELPQGLDTVIGESGHKLSVGQARKITLARVFAAPIKSVYVLDEPTAGLDRTSVDRLFAHLTFLKSKGSAVLFSTHIAEEKKYCDEIIRMHKCERPKYDLLVKSHTSNFAVI